MKKSPILILLRDAQSVPGLTLDLLCVSTRGRLVPIGSKNSFSPRSLRGGQALLSNNNTTSSHRQYDYGESEKYGSWRSRGGHETLRKPYEDYSSGSGSGSSGPSSGTSKPFMSSLASMNGPSPEEKRKTERRRRRLQEDLAAQVQAQTLVATKKEVVRFYS